MMKKIPWIIIAIASFTIIAVGGTIYFIKKDSPQIEEPTAESSVSFTDQFNTIIIGWDGVQRDHFFKCYNQELSECAQGLPNIKELSENKIYNLTVTNGATSTKPGWVQILTGYNAEVSGTSANNNYSPIPEGYTIFEKVENKYPEIQTIFLAAKVDNLGGVCKNEQKAEGKTELTGEPWCNVKKELTYFQNGLDNNETVGNRTLEMLNQYRNSRFLLFVHFKEPDSEGHSHGENSAEYSNAIIDNDTWLGKIIAQLRELNIFSKTMVYVVSDHGFDLDSKSHNNAPFSIYATNDKEVIRTADRRDIAPTILKKYNVNLEKNGNVPAVNGFPLDVIPSRCLRDGESYLDYEGAPQCCAGLRLTNLDLVSESGKVTLATGGSGDRSGICIK